MLHCLFEKFPKIKSDWSIYWLIVFSANKFFLYRDSGKGFHLLAHLQSETHHLEFPYRKDWLPDPLMTANR